MGFQAFVSLAGRIGRGSRPDINTTPPPPGSAECIFPLVTFHDRAGTTFANSSSKRIEQVTHPTTAEKDSLQRENGRTLLTYPGPRSIGIITLWRG